MFWTIEFSGIDERPRRKEAVVVRSAHHHWNRVQFERVEGFLSDVVFTESVLKTQVKSNQSLYRVSKYIYLQSYL